MSSLSTGKKYPDWLTKSRNLRVKVQRKYVSTISYSQKHPSSRWQHLELEQLDNELYPIIWHTKFPTNGLIGNLWALYLRFLKNISKYMLSSNTKFLGICS